MGWIARRLGARQLIRPRAAPEDRAAACATGARLRTVRFDPPHGGKRPAILMRIAMASAGIPRCSRCRSSRASSRGAATTRCLDTRGRYGSEGTFYPMRDEADDGRDTLEWVSKQPWFDGRLGMWGASYFGYTQLSVAANPPPYLRRWFRS
jgi:putative CocE/NonD family hydrolase